MRSSLRCQPFSSAQRRTSTRVGVRLNDQLRDALQNVRRGAAKAHDQLSAHAGHHHGVDRIPGQRRETVLSQQHHALAPWTSYESVSYAERNGARRRSEAIARSAMPRCTAPRGTARDRCQRRRACDRAPAAPGWSRASPRAARQAGGGRSRPPYITPSRTRRPIRGPG